ncbi:hypothetical protein GQ41_1169 [Arenibacter algicola]|uniref:Nuclease-related domain protein n=1 Tax=Arenibacter algicola TaxID=616991 RepID=A0ABY3A8C0_9FLAO
MALEIRHNRAEHAHENFQFRRIAQGLDAFFEQKGWDGLLIGNPESEDFSRFRADAILIYNHGFLIIDLKDYQGNIELPKHDDDFGMLAWYNESEKDKTRLEIKGGARFLNPFRQLKSYRQVMYDIINSNLFLKDNINPSRTCALNLFSGAIQLNRETPRNIPYYKITQESDFYDFLYDYNSPNTYSKEVADALNNIFPAPIWEAHHEVQIEEEIAPKRIYEIDGDVENEIKSFLQEEGSGILVLESMDYSKRDDWMRYILSESATYNIPQTETWTHSTRIRRKIKLRSGIAPDSLFNTIYGGKSDTKEDKNSDVEEDNNEETEDLIEVIPIKSDDLLDKSAVVILQEAHLVSRSLHQSELLRFGSGRLLEDLILFLDLESTNRKLICIGDPFSLSYGNDEESGIALETLKELFKGKIQLFRQTPQRTNTTGIHKQRVSLATSINDKVFNKLLYGWNTTDVLQSNKSNSLALLKQWFSKPLTAEPTQSVLFFTNDLALSTNIWIKKNCLNNSSDLAIGDLLLLNNNVNIPDDTGFGNPARLYNGMYIVVKETSEPHTETIIINKQSKQQITLQYIKLKVQCLSLENKQDAEIWLNDTYFKSNGKLSKEEQIALRIFTSKKLKSFKKANPFEQSGEFKALQQNSQNALLKKQIENFTRQLASGEKVKGKLNEAEVNYRKLENKYKRKYNHRVLMEILSNDPILNAINATYGWCTTVHKAVGSVFQDIIINAKQGEFNGVGNASYFRWLYSGLSTAQSRVYVSNPIEIDPFMDCQFEDVVEDGWRENITRQNNSFEFDDFEIPERFSGALTSELNQNAKAAICLFAESIEKSGVLLERTQKSGDYISKAYFSTPNNGVGDLVMIFNNNGSGKVTSIRPERNGEAIMEFIEKGISNILSLSNNETTDEVSFPDDFRKEIYKDLIERSIQIDSELKLVKSHDYHDIFVLLKGDSKVKFRLGYNGSGMFTSVKVLAKSNSNISIELHNLFFADE